MDPGAKRLNSERGVRGAAAPRWLRKLKTYTERNTTYWRLDRPYWGSKKNAQFSFPWMFGPRRAILSDPLGTPKLVPHPGSMKKLRIGHEMVWEPSISIENRTIRLEISMRIQP